jgi:hypothetical protein
VVEDGGATDEFARIASVDDGVDEALLDVDGDPHAAEGPPRRMPL